MKRTTATRPRFCSLATVSAFRLVWAQLPAIRRIVHEEGLSSLWRGLQPRVMFHVPSAAVCWGTYETCKRLLAAPDLEASH